MIIFLLTTVQLESEVYIHVYGFTCTSFMAVKALLIKSIRGHYIMHALSLVALF